jgi:APA family basic amino acid/polyamine antiporter
LHGVRRSHGARTQNILVAIKLLLIAGFAAYGLSRLPSLAPEPGPADFTLGTFAVTLMFISFSYSGWNAAVYVAGEVREPRRNLPRALLWGTIGVMVIYLVLNAVFVYAAPVDQLTATFPEMAAIGATAAKALGGEGLANFIRVIVSVGLLTSVSSMVMAGPRVYAKMADDGVFPRVFAFTSQVPAAAIWFQVFLAIIVLWFATLRQLLGYVGFTLSLSTAVAVIGLVILRQKEGPEKVPVPGYPWVPALFILTTLTIGGLMLSTGQGEPIAGLVTVVVGVVVYALVRRGSRAVGD